jgi:hypothetical protein
MPKEVLKKKWKRFLFFNVLTPWPRKLCVARGKGVGVGGYV